MKFLALASVVAASMPLATGADAGSAAAATAAATPKAVVASADPAADTTANGGERPSSHDDSNGLKLVAASEDEPDPAGSTCRRGAPVRGYDIAAIAVDITVNRYLDHDPRGAMFVLRDDIERVRQEELQNTAARASTAEPAVTVGLQGDAIQPLVLRVRPGECLRLSLEDQLPGDERVSLHVHGAGLQVVGGGPAVIANPDAIARQDRPVAYEWQVPDDEPEATHYFHSSADERRQVDHGLFGALVVEPPGSRWIDPRTGRDLTSGWDAIVVADDQPAFREFVLVYHEIGDETYQLTDRAGRFLPLVDPLTSAYRPGGRALNYRSEPFMDRLRLGQQQTAIVDESLAYSSYAFGDPATPIMRAELGDPTKQRVVHGGSEVFHVHHVHGGATRWARQPGVEDASLGAGLEKKPPLVPTATELTDSQSIGPSETFDVVNECGAGGCQQSAGDFLYHCHIAHHYFAGMWGIWRVYNTRQDGPASTDGLPPLEPLPDRLDATAAAVPARDLAGTTVSWYGREFPVTDATLGDWVAAQLPPPGVPKGYDAAVWDWVRDGDRWLGEPETPTAWPGYTPSQPGVRPDILFDPNTGKLAYPLLRPHLARRPPFAPNHGPAPFLDPPRPGAATTAVPAPGASGKGSLCPSGTKPKQFDINAITLPIAQNAKHHIVDGQGLLYVLRQQEARVRDDPAMQVPLAIRSNAGEDCVDILLRNDVPDSPSNAFCKIGLHSHFVQFDVQGSDGLDTGFNYEQTVRPFRNSGTAIGAAVTAGAGSLSVADASAFTAGAVVGIGLDQESTFESARIASIDGSTLTFAEPLSHAHRAGEVVSSEFVRYRYYPDAQFGTTYFHDHVDAIHRWKHGLFGALIAEPPGSTYHDPRTGEELASGPIADIHTDARVSTDVSGSFRELALFVQDENPLSAVGRSPGGAYNLRTEPLDLRGGDPALLFSSAEHGDPVTPIVDAYLGDPVVIRSLVGATNDVHTVHIDGHWFRTEPNSTTSPPVNTVHLGISERYDLVLPAAGGPQRQPGDYLYYSGRTFKLREGSWGIVRVRGDEDADLAHLPGRDDVPAASTATCPADAPVKRFDVSAVEVALPMLGGKRGKVFVLDSARDAVVAGAVPAEPLVLHVNVGDCIDVRVTNATSDGPITYHCDLLSYDPATSGGVAGGHQPDLSIGTGETGDFRFYASPEVGETVSLLRDWGDVLTNPGLGLYGAIVVGPEGATYRGTGTAVDVIPRDGEPYRDFTLFLQDQDEQIGTHRMPYTTQVRGPVAVNYTAAPLDDLAPGALPATPLLRAYTGDPVRLNVVAPWSEQNQVFSIENHSWPVEPGRAGTTIASSVHVGGLEAISLRVASAGGAEQVAGDYRYGAHRGPYLEAGQWGVFRVVGDEEEAGLEPLPGPDGTTRAPVAIGGSIALLVALAALGLRRRKVAVAGHGGSETQEPGEGAQPSAHDRG